MEHSASWGLLLLTPSGCQQLDLSTSSEQGNIYRSRIYRPQSIWHQNI